MVSYNSANFGGHRHRGSEEIVFHVTSESSNLIGRSPPSLVTILSDLYP